MSVTDDYFIVLRDNTAVDGRPKYTGHMPSEDGTADYIYERGPISRGRPLVFDMDEPELRRSQNYPGEIGDFIVSGGDVLVSQKVNDILVEHQSPRSEMYPAVLKDIDGNDIEPLYYLHIWEELDVWDRERSEYLMPYNPNDNLCAALTRIALNEDAIAAIPHEDRQYFLLENVGKVPLLFHKDLLSLLIEKNVTSGAIFFNLSEFEEGIQFR